MATTKLKIRNDLVKKLQGAHTVVYIQYCYNRKIKLFNTGKKIDPEYWDHKKECVKNSYRGYTSLNAVLKSEKAKIENIVNEAQFKNIEPTLEYVKQQYENLSKPAIPEINKNFFQLYDEYIENCKAKKARNTVKQHRTTYNHIKGFEIGTGYKITLETISLDFYGRFISYLIEVKGMSPNSIGDIIKNLKIFLGDLTDRGINTNITFKKKEFKKPSAPVEIITLTQVELDKLFTQDLSKNSRLEKVRDLFCFACTTGMRFSDVSNLKPENIKDGFIQLTTVKTKDRLFIPLNPYSKNILNKYGGSLPKVISNQKMNDYLKELGKLAGISDSVQRIRYVGAKRIETTVPKYELISSHTARRSFITLSLEKGMRPEEIMKITGHKNIKTMMRYVNITIDVTRSSMLRAWSDAPSQIKIG